MKKTIVSLLLLMLLMFTNVCLSAVHRPQAFDLNIDANDFVFQELFTTAVFAPYGGNGSTYTDSGTNYSATNGKLNKIEWPTTGSKTPYYTLSSVKSIQNATIIFRYYIPSGKEPTSLTLRVYDSTNTAFYDTSYCPVSAGRHVVAYSLGGLAEWGGTVDTTDIKYIKLDLVTGDVNDTIYIDSIQFVSNYIKPRIVLCFDNGYIECYTIARPKLNLYNYDGVFYVNKAWSDPLGDGEPVSGAHMSVAQLLQLQTEGHLIGNHTVNHTLNSTSLFWEVVDEFKTNQNWLYDIGVTSGRFYACMPRGSLFFDGVDEATKAQKLEWLMDINFHNRLTFFMNKTDTANYYVNIPIYNRVAYAQNPKTYTAAKALVDKVVANRELLVLYFHNLDGLTDISTADFNALIDYIATQDVEVVTFEDLMPFERQNCVKGDLNNDCKVDFEDIAILSTNWLKDNSQ